MEKRDILLVKDNKFYHCDIVYFGTIHKKEEVIAPLLFHFGINCIAVKIDTDSLGTFSGEVKRPGTMLETLRSKIQLVIRKIPHAKLIMASEGSFGPHPSLPFVKSNQETLMFYDRKHDLEIVSSDVSLITNLNEIVLKHNNSYEKFLKDVLFPSHGLILESDGKLLKGINNLHFLEETIDQIFKNNKESSIKLSTDMRANFNPTRMKFIEEVGKNLINKIFTFCPTCQMPGFGIIKFLPGLPCRDCGHETNSYLFKVYKCEKCGFEEQKKRDDNVIYANPGECDVCNP
jgi:ribosomal protein L37E